MTFAKSIVAAVLLALSIQYPVALVFIAIPAILGDASFSELVGFVTFYWFWVTMVAAPIIVIFGVPIYLWLRARSIASTRNVLISGALLAAVLAAVSMWIFFPGSGFSSGENYYGTFRDMVIDGVPTFWGWVGLAEDILVFAIHGALGAAFFGFGWRKYEPQARIDIRSI